MPARRPRPQRVYAAAVVIKAGRVLLGQRPADALLGGLWAFPAAECPSNSDLGGGLSQALRDGWGIQVSVGAQVQTLFHGFTHFKLMLHVFDCHWLAGRVKPGAGPRRWVRLVDLDSYPMGKTDRQIAQALRAPRTPRLAI